MPIQGVYYPAGRTPNLRRREKGLQTLENDGQHSHPGDEEVDATANVVHFPGDWFGPREELVPVGPRATPKDDAEGPGRAERRDRGKGLGHGDADEVAAPTPVRADDFWGKASASIHDAMEGPSAPEPASPVQRRKPTRRFRRPALPAMSGGRGALRVAGVGCAAVLLVIAVVGSVWRPGSTRGTRESAGLAPAVIVPSAPVVSAPSVHARARTARSRPRAHRARAHRPASRAHSSAGASSQSAAAPASQPQSAETVAQSSAPAPSASSGTATSTPAQASSDTGGGGGGGGQAAGPAGPGAPFGPGHLG